MTKRKTRGKAKPTPVEAMRLAYVARRVQRGDQIFVADRNRRLVHGKHWAEQMFWKTAGAKARTLSDADNELRRIKRSDSEALRALATYSRQWDTENLTWGERALKMVDLGFSEFRDMKRGQWERMRDRAAKFYPGQVSQRKSKVRQHS